MVTLELSNLRRDLVEVAIGLGQVKQAIETGDYFNYNQRSLGLYFAELTQFLLRPEAGKTAQLCSYFSGTEGNLKDNFEIVVKDYFREKLKCGWSTRVEMEGGVIGWVMPTKFAGLQMIELEREEMPGTFHTWSLKWIA